MGLAHEPSWWLQGRVGSRILVVLVHRGTAPRPRSVNRPSSCQPSCQPRQPHGLPFCGTTMNADAQQAEAEAAERAKAATEAVLALAQKLHDEYVAEARTLARDSSAKGSHAMTRLLVRPRRGRKS